MRTVGQILKEERERKFYTLEEIEKATKIRKELLEALENDQYEKLPPPTFVQGFIRNYGKFLRLDPEKLLAIFRREFQDSKHPPKILESFSNPLDKRKIRLTPVRILQGVIAALILTFFIYLWFQYRFLAGPPSLEIYSPKDQQRLESEIVEVSGKTIPEAKVLINNQEVEVDKEGNFRQELHFSEGTGKITITSTSKLNQTAKVERVVYLTKE
ncbi:MAG: hypothetical protein G01um101493_317 [Microgenomates group bacterium Gr01-1014_93]|nr:MAG: hypothetical protein G01um101493_317 [Microgenomates group bacterium Gr01-1014_93]